MGQKSVFKKVIPSEKSSKMETPSAISDRALNKYPMFSTLLQTKYLGIVNQKTLLK